jgi:hypothetical protein
MARLSVFVCLFLFRIAGVYAQPAGFPPSVVHLPEEYGGTNQVWAFAEDKRGWIWAGLNNGTAVVFDGVTWHMAAIPTRNMIRSLAYDAVADRMYTGGAGEFGFFAPDSAQQVRYVSLASLLPEPKPVFSDVWRVFRTDETWLYQSRNLFFEYNDATGSLNSLPDAEGNFLMYRVDGQAVLYRRGKGIFSRSGGDWIKRPFETAFSGVNLRAILPLNRDRLLIASTDSGLAVLDRESGARIQDERVSNASRQLLASRIYTMIALRDGGWAVGTLDRGVYVLSADFGVRYHFHENIGLADLNVWSLFEDRQGWLWIGTNYGIGRVNLRWPIELLDRRAGVHGIIENASFDGQQFYAASSAGVLRWNGNQFEKMPGSAPDGWDLASGVSKNGKPFTYVASTNGVARIDGDKTIPVFTSDEVVFSVLMPEFFPGFCLREGSEVCCCLM